MKDHISKQNYTSQWRQNWEYNHQKEGNRNGKEWRNVITLGSKLGDREDIKRRKELSNSATSNNKTI